MMVSIDIDRLDINVPHNQHAKGFEIEIPDEVLNGYQDYLSLYDADGKQISGSPYRIGNNFCDCLAEVVNGNHLQGKVYRHGLSKEPIALSISLDGQPFTSRTATFQSDSSENDLAFASFSCILPKNVLDGNEHVVSIESANNQCYVSSPDVIFHSKYVGKIDSITSRKIMGWVANLSAPGMPVDVDVYINGRLTAIEKAHIPYPTKIYSGIDLGSKIGFDIEIPIQSSSTTTLEIELKVGGCQTLLFQESYVFTTYDTILRSLEYCSNVLNQLPSNENGLTAGIGLEQLDMRWLKNNLIAPLIQEFRVAKSIPNNLNINLQKVSANLNKEISNIIDVIIPAYRGKDETLACIRSVIEAENRCLYELIVINDHSPDLELVTELRKLAGSGKITLRENSKNQGFVKTVNTGMRMHPNRDVVLLNSDTVVPNGWLDRLYASAYLAQNIGTVTPFTNSGTICSFPEMNVEASLPDNTDVHEIDKAFSRNPLEIHDIPTAVGFCMFIKRKAIDEAGLFDEETWKKGYGEENDFCLRAASLGWRSVIATNLFVQHHGSISFSSSRDSLIAENLPKLNHRYPDYELRVSRFIKDDPLAKFRNPVIKTILNKNITNSILFIVHSLGGGAGHAATVLAQKLIDEGQSVLILSILKNKKWELRVAGTPYRMVYESNQSYENLIQDLKELGVWHVHYHQTMDFPKLILELPKLLGVNYDFTAHDFMPICPRVNFVDETERFCGDSRFSISTCIKCIEMNGLENSLKDRYKEFNQDVGLWRLTYRAFLEGARRVIAPSHDTAKRYGEHYMLKNIVVKAHPEENYVIPENKPLNDVVSAEIFVAVIGAIGLHKGYRVLTRCAQRALKDGLPIKFVVIGHTYDDELMLELPNVEITGKYEPENLQKIISQYGCRVALFLSTWPETFSYTLSEAWQNGLYPIGLDIGAIGERIKDSGFGVTVPVDASPAEINSLILDSVANQLACSNKVMGESYPDILRQYYGFDSELRNV